MVIAKRVLRPGIGDPVFEGQITEEYRVVGRGKLTREGGWARLETGEFLLGHPDEAHEYPPAPPPILLSRNGTFMVYRKLHEFAFALCAMAGVLSIAERACDSETGAGANALA